MLSMNNTVVSIFHFLDKLFYVADSYIKVHRSTVMIVCIGDNFQLPCMLFISPVNHSKVLLCMLIKQKTGCYKLSSLLTYRKTCPAQDPSSPESFPRPVPVQYPSISNISWEFCAATIFPCFFLGIDI